MGLCIIQIITIANERAPTETRTAVPQLNAKKNPRLKNKRQKKKWNFCVAIAEWIVTFSKLLLIR